MVQPRATTAAIVGLHGDALKVKVTAPPVDERANRAVELLVARVLDVPRSTVSVISGHSSRRKRVEVRGIDVGSVQRAIGHVLTSPAHDPG